MWRSSDSDWEVHTILVDQGYLGAISFCHREEHQRASQNH